MPSQYTDGMSPPVRRDPVIEAYKAGLDRTLLRESLRRTPEERLRALMELQRFAAELRRAGAALRRSNT
jgi:hypothetical protein